jgi:DNA-binding CsgD family transcriptional regulator
MTLVGRARELAVLAGLLDRCDDTGTAIAVLGEAGIGKSTLLDAAARRAVDTQVLRVRGTEGQAELAFAGLADLLGPALEHLEALPAPQAAALSGALALGPPSPGDRFAVCAATHGIIARAASRRRLLVLVDDMQWLDRPSRECVLYLARRPPARVAVLLALRADQAEHPPADIDALRLQGLADADARRLLEAQAPDLAGPVVTELVAIAGGNPLALVELPAALTADQRAGRAALERLAVPGPALHRAFSGRLAGLPAPSRTALLVLATEGTGDLAPVARACASLGVAVADLEAAEATGLLRLVDGRAELVHSVVGAIAYHCAPPADRRRVHAALAAASSGDRAAWHWAAAAVGPHEEAARALERTAAHAGARRGYATAAAALERAAQLSGDTGDQTRRLVEAAGLAVLSGLPQRARAMLEGLDDLDPGPEVRIRAAHLRGLLDNWNGDVVVAGDCIERAARDLGGADPVGAAGLFADAAMVSTAAGDCHEALRRAQAGADLLAAATTAPAHVRCRVLAAHAWALVLRGQSARARPILSELDRQLTGVDLLSTEAQPLVPAINLRLLEQGYERARGELLAMVSAAREAGALAAIPMPLAVAGQAAERLGDWAAARAEAAEVVDLAWETDQRMPRCLGLLLGATVDAATGHVDEARARIGQVLEITTAARIGSGVVWATAVLGFLELGLGRIPEALTPLKAVESWTLGYGMDEPTLIPWMPDLIEVLTRMNQVEDARRLTRRLTAQARASGTPAAAALAARCRGIVNPGTGEREFERALELHARVPLPFERARTQLAYGAKLRRAARRADARRLLTCAVETFTELGAQPWVEQARAELGAAGARRRPDPQELTPAERRVVEAVARGATNQQAAVELFLSPKTVDYHLRGAYRKLGVHNRSQLTLALRPSQAPDQPPPHPVSPRQVGSSSSET